MVELPLAQSEPAPALPSAIGQGAATDSLPAGEQSRPGRSVMVAGDNRDAADSLALRLGLWGCEVHAAYDRVDGLRLAQGWAPDAAFTDIGTPGMDGCELHVHCGTGSGYRLGHAGRRSTQSRRRRRPAPEQAGRPRSAAGGAAAVAVTSVGAASRWSAATSTLNGLAGPAQHRRGRRRQPRQPRPSTVCRGMAA